MNEKYARLVQLAAWAAIVMATILLLIKLGTWWYTSSVSLLASLVDSLLDLLASLTNLLVVRYAIQPADEEHKFGHGKAESLAALAQSAFIVGSACFLLLNGVEQLIRPTPLNHPETGMLVSAIATAFTAGLVLFQKWVVRQTGSQAIAADSLHYQSDLLMNIAIMIALGLVWWGFPAADGIFAVLIAGYILYSASRMAYEAVQSLLDRQLEQEDQDKIMQLASSESGVEGVHDLRTRQAGVTKFIQLHLELNDDLKLIDAHRIAEAVEFKLKTAFPSADILIHQDPVSAVALAKIQNQMCAGSAAN